MAENLKNDGQVWIHNQESLILDSNETAYAHDTVKSIKGGGSGKVCGVVIDRKRGGGYYQLDDGPMFGTGPQETADYTRISIPDGHTFRIYGALVVLYVKYE